MQRIRPFPRPVPKRGRRRAVGQRKIQRVRVNPPLLGRRSRDLEQHSATNQNTQQHEASRGLSAIAEFLVIQYRDVTDGQTDGRTDRIAVSISRVSVLTRDKKWIISAIITGRICSFFLLYYTPNSLYWLDVGPPTKTLCQKFGVLQKVGVRTPTPPLPSGCALAKNGIFWYKFAPKKKSRGP